MTDPGTIVILNGPPRSGKSSIAAAIQDDLEGVWLNMGVDAFSMVIPERYQPGIGLRPGGEGADLEDLIPVLFDALYGWVIASSRLGLNVVVDVGHHDDYSEPLGILGRVAHMLAGLPAYFIGVRCAIPEIMRRRDAGEPGREDRYVGSGPDGAVPEIVRRWERAVHDPGVYDLEVDTAAATPHECARSIQRRIDDGPPMALLRLSTRSR